MIAASIAEGQARTQVEAQAKRKLMICVKSLNGADFLHMRALIAAKIMNIHLGNTSPIAEGVSKEKSK